VLKTHCAHNTKPYQQTQEAWIISTKIISTMHSIRSASFLCHKNGCAGASHAWCSLETKPDAKTINLCVNDPLHKEPKVSMAKRIISGDLLEESWIEFDVEGEQYEKEYLESLLALNQSPAHS
jgi:hypothetical protein